MPTLIDTHAHLTWDTVAPHVEQIVQRAREAGVLRIVDLGTDLDSSRRARDHAHTFSEVVFAAGVHPNDAGAARRNDLDEIEELLADPRCAALGEIGLDFYREHTEPIVQEEWFRGQLNLAKRTGKPVVIHDRQASDRLLEVLEEERYDGIDGPGGVFHCFAGGVAMAREVIARGFMISFTGNITFKNSDRPEVVAEVPLERMMLETDTPFMAPVPKRGRPNEPAYVPHIAAKVAEIKGVTLEEVAEVTTRNAVRFFGLDRVPGGAPA